MVAICIYFQVHQPKRLRKYTYFDIGNSHFYENEEENRNIFLKVAQKCYLPTNTLLLELLKKHNSNFKIAYSLTGVFIEQCKRFCPAVLDSFKRLVDTGKVELLNETYYHSLSFIYSKDEFIRQVKLHHQLIKDEFKYTATTFRNTELIYNNDVAKAAEDLGYSAILAEGAEKILGWRSANYIYQPHNCSKIKLLLRNYRLTDDVAFRFSEKTWSEYPVYAEKYAGWLHSLYGQADVINLFMDFETFGEHQWAETGIFEFLRYLPDYILRHPEYEFKTPCELSATLRPVATLDVPNFVSWADVDRDLTAWCGNNLQDDALHAVYSMEKKVLASHDDNLIKTWRSLLTSDHFYYMCTKYSADGDVHKYFNPYRNPYDAYINYQNVLADFALVLEQQAQHRRVSGGVSVHKKIIERLINWLEQYKQEKYGKGKVSI
jgi:alpha-amylase